MVLFLKYTPARVRTRPRDVVDLPPHTPHGNSFETEGSNQHICRQSTCYWAHHHLACVNTGLAIDGASKVHSVKANQVTEADKVSVTGKPVLAAAR